ncbi:MAG: GIY-YIG nuclease family protein [Planctomycetes bacterium]|nr:GIY-YIG nuclease family protein [Planctomycetota bacterium]
MTRWSVYLVRTAAGELYTGVATDVARRFAEHAAGRGAKYLRGRGPLALVYRRGIGEQGLALRVERRIKRLERAEKERLVRARPTRARLIELLDTEPGTSLTGSPRSNGGSGPRREPVRKEPGSSRA